MHRFLKVNSSNFYNLFFSSLFTLCECLPLCGGGAAGPRGGGCCSAARPRLTIYTPHRALDIYTLDIYTGYLLAAPR